MRKSWKDVTNGQKCGNTTKTREKMRRKRPWAIQDANKEKVFNKSSEFQIFNQRVAKTLRSFLLS